MKHITPTELAAWLADAAQAPPLLLDVREPWEYALGHLETSVPVPMRQVPAALTPAAGAGAPVLDTTRPIVCICHHGGRSMQVAQYLEQSGARDVYNLSGGVDAWSRQVDPAFPKY